MLLHRPFGAPKAMAAIIIAPEDVEPMFAGRRNAPHRSVSIPRCGQRARGRQ